MWNKQYQNRLLNINVHLLAIFIKRHSNGNVDSSMKRKIYGLGIKLGLNKKDINDIMKDTSMRDEQTSFSLGPPGYPGSFYGTVSINDFEKYP